MKHDRTFAWMMAIAIAGTTMTACSSDSNEPEKPFTTDPVEQVRLFACEPADETRAAAIDTLFTEDDIEWFNVSTTSSAPSSYPPLIPGHLQGNPSKSVRQKESTASLRWSC